MALVSMRQLLDHAAEHGYGLPAFNINNMEQIRAIMLAAHECDSPVILQASAGARKYTGEAFLRHMVEAAVETWPHIPVVLHQDHGASPAVCQRSIRSGFTSVMMDGSLMEDMKTPAIIRIQRRGHPSGGRDGPRRRRLGRGRAGGAGIAGNRTGG